MDELSFENMSYEQKIERLQQIVGRLENENLGLDESVKLFEEGTKLAAECSKTLDAAEAKFRKLGGDE